MKTACVILAGGAGKRMKSERPKVLGWVLDAAKDFGFNETAVVTGFGAELTGGYVSSRSEAVTLCHQAQQKGTGDAVKSAEDVISRCDAVCVLNGDAPFIDADTLRASLELHTSSNSEVTVITADIDDPQGYGRIIRSSGEFTAIREQKDCSPAEAEICEVNSGAYWFSAKALLQTLPKLSTNNAAGEYYLTDCVEMMSRRQAYKSANPDIVLGANTRGALLELNQLARLRKLSRLMDEGVSFITLDGIIIGTDVRIGCDTTILPNTVILGNTTIGKGCTIGANSHIENCTIGDNVQLNNVQAYDSVVENNVKIGPFAQLRPGTTIREDRRFRGDKEQRYRREHRSCSPDLRRRQRRRQRGQFRLRLRYRELRRNKQVPHEDRRSRVHRLQHQPYRPGGGRRKRLHCGWLDSNEECSR